MSGYVVHRQINVKTKIIKHVYLYVPLCLSVSTTSMNLNVYCSIFSNQFRHINSSTYLPILYHYLFPYLSPPLSTHLYIHLYAFIYQDKYFINEFHKYVSFSDVQYIYVSVYPYVNTIMKNVCHIFITNYFTVKIAGR